MKYSCIPFIAALCVWLFVTDLIYFDFPPEKSFQFNAGHALFLQIGIAAGSLFANIHYFRHSKIFKRNIAAMRYEDI